MTSGVATDAQAWVQGLLEELTGSGEERGLQVAAYFDGELVVDAWSGVADAESGRAMDGETLFTVFSVGKAVAATVVHRLAERGLLEYDAPVDRYWPEFGANGKDGVTVRQVLTHSAGVPQLPEGATIADLCDWERICGLIAELPLLWEFGTKVGYHATTYGFIVGELVRRVAGRPFPAVVAEEICRPLGMTGLYFGVPAEVEARVARLEAAPQPEARQIQPESLIARAMGPVPRTPAVWNRSDIRRACIPAAGGIASARAIARHYAALVGEGVDGVRLLSPERVRLATALQTDARDAVIGLPVRRGLGYTLGGPLSPLGDRLSAFGHGGTGGSTGFADPEHRFAFALLKNRLVPPAPGESTALRVARVVREALGIPEQG